MRSAVGSRWLDLGLCVLVLAPAAGRAVGGEPGPINELVKGNRALMSAATPALKPGEWVAYLSRIQVTTKSGMPFVESIIKVSCPLHTGEKPLAEGQLWLEFEMSDPTNSEANYFALKMLVDGDPRRPESIKKMYLSSGKRIPFEIPQDMLASSGSTESPCDQGDGEGCRAKGGEHSKGQVKRIYTKVGWLSAQQVIVRLPGDKGTREFWVSENVPILGFVKASMESGIQLELEGYGSGALSRIDESRAVPIPDVKAMEGYLQGKSP